MKNLVILFYLSLMLMVATGCGCYKHIPVVNTVIRDSVVVHVKDSTIFHIDTIMVYIPDESRAAIIASSDSSHLETSVATSDAYIDSLGRLHHSLDNKAGATLEKEIQVPETFHTQETETFHTQDEKETITIEVERQLTWWQKLWMTSGKILWGLLIVAVLYLIAKLVLSRFIKPI